MHIGYNWLITLSIVLLLSASCENHSGWLLSLLIYACYNNNNSKPFALELSSGKL